jgi:hypothetical protein
MNNGKEFEFELLRLLQAMGFEAEVTGYSQDGGVDLVATNSGPLAAGKCVVQCKARARPVGEPVLRDLFGTMHAQGANKGILITTSSFTAAALRFAQGKPLELIDGALYRELCEQHGLPAYGTGVEAAPDELLQPDSPNVRIISFDCTDPRERKSYQDWVFAVGALSLVGNTLAFRMPGGSFFRIDDYQMLEVGNHYIPGSNERGSLTLTFTSRGDRYIITFEGRSGLIETLYYTFSPESRPKTLPSASPSTSPAPVSSGCIGSVVMFFVIMSLFALLLHGCGQL